MQDILLYIPFIYFVIILLYIYARQGFSIASCIIGLYMVMSGLAIPLYYDNYIQDELYSIILSPSATIVFCITPTLVTLPFYKFNSNQKRHVYTINTTLFDILSWISIVTFFVLIILFSPEIISRLTTGSNIADLRIEMLSSESAALGQSTGLSHYIGVIANIFSCISWIAFPLTFYSICFLNKSRLFNILLALSSLSCMVQSIILVDRSTLFFLVIRFVFSYFLFRPYFTAQLKAKIIFLSSILLFIAFLYLLYITISRFAEDSLHSLLYYFGQNYLYFSTFWNDLVPPQPNFAIFHPIWSYLTSNNDFGTNAVEYGKYLSDELGYFINVFYTFMGSIIIYVGKNYVIPFGCIYYLFTRIFIYLKGQLSIYHILLLFTLAQMPLCGVITYIYTEFGSAIGFVFLFSICIYGIYQERFLRIKKLK